MPIPTVPKKKPRRLLRDVAYEQILDLIMTGQAQAGERLLDAELTEWLGTSRTPAREALSRLASEGLIEMEANRYTKVAERSIPLARDATHLLFDLHRIARDRVSKHARFAGIATRVKGARSGIVAEDTSALHRTWKVMSEAVELDGSPLLINIEYAIHLRARFQTIPGGGTVEWGAALKDVDDFIVGL